MSSVFIGLGSNLGEREENLKTAIHKLSLHPEIDIMKKSSIKETVPVDYLDQPLFLNQIVEIRTALGPHDLLKFLKKTESDMGRTFIVSKGPRLIDLDILIYDKIILDSRDLCIPHREIKNRDFIMEHLVELCPYLTDPATGEFYTTVMLSLQEVHQDA